MSDILDKLADEVDKIEESNATASPAVKKSAQKGDGKKEEDEKEELSIMDELIEKGGLGFLQVGSTIEGTVIEVSSNEIYLDLAPYGTGIVLGKEIKDGMASGKLKIGDKVSATISELENEDGYIELSIREASYEKAWKDIEIKKDALEKVATKVISANKGGLLVEINGISGFLPVSQLSSQNYPRVEDGDRNKILNLLKKLVGREMEVRILDADRESEKLIVSEKAAQSEKDRKVISMLSVGDVISGEVSGVVDFGAFVKFTVPSESTGGEDKLEGLVHISELAWQLIEDPRTIVKVGDKVSAKIIGIDADKISLSIRSLLQDPWSLVAEQYKVGDVVRGAVHKINHFGAFVYLNKDIHGLAHISEMAESYPRKTMEELIKVGEEYDWTILSIEPKDHRMGLVLSKGTQKSQKKQNDPEENAQNDAEKGKVKKEENQKDEEKAQKKVKAEKEEKVEKKEKKEVKTKKTEKKEEKPEKKKKAVKKEEK